MTVGEDPPHEDGDGKDIARRTKSGFSDKASEAFFDSITRYVGDLEQLCRFMSKRTNSDIVSESHVDSAELAMGTTQASKVVRHLGAFGGVLLGVGLGNFFAMVNAEKYETFSVIFTFIFALVGAALVVYHAARD